MREGNGHPRVGQYLHTGEARALPPSSEAHLGLPGQDEEATARNEEVQALDQRVQPRLAEEHRQLAAVAPRLQRALRRRDCAVGREKLAAARGRLSVHSALRKYIVL